MKSKLTIYCDGSCSYRSRLGGIGVYIIDDTWQEWFISKGYEDTTISRMEGIALLTAIQSINKNLEVEAVVYSDSEYIIKSFTENRFTKWQMIGWQNVKNVDMWKAILLEIKLHPLLELTFIHIRGHQEVFSGTHAFGNSVADALANYKIHKTYNSDKNL